MGNKKNIDRLFQEKFKDFEVFPDRDLWADIGAKLDGIPLGASSVPERQKKATPAFWWRLGGIAAAIALLLSLGLNFLSTEPADIPDDVLEKVVNGPDKPAEGKEISREGDLEDNDPLVSTGNAAKPGKDGGKTTDPSQSVKTQGPRNTGTGSASPQESNSQGGTGIAQQGNDPKNANTDQQSANTEIAVTDPPSAKNKGEINKGNQIENPRIADVSDKEQNKAEGTGATEKNTAQATTDKEKTGIRDKEEKPKKSLLEAIAEMENESEREKELASKQGKGTGKWSINPNVAPVYYNSISGGSPIASEFKESPKSGKVNLSYGINVAYKVSKRVSVRSGVNRVNYGYNTNDVAITPSLLAQSLDNINYSRPTERASAPYVSNAKDKIDPPLAANQEIASSFASQEGHMQQEFGYIEVPMEVKYRVVDQRLGLNLIGGVSSLFLTDNALLVKSGSSSTKLGESNNLNDVNFSTNVGLGVDYLLSDQLQLQIEPMFKYQWNAFSNDSGGFRPYSFGVYTGFSFRF
ncbi:outer membrane beta-barrel protein [Sinomicrobium weinanense]|uniref:Outer membrane beta-barrel protein n=1 Tax=Sinomicrobium weinanense TaxID=2842200 RepID=A0A926Q2D9_9FLAO|nr:outer membrane beta-barrel protein [Sinomicrobium weinanense]MBC9794575.1 outer membrane beta-barrel protein [Sinomicrobium weinanense]MBU3124060.1 outer membrane beta-barrel protein [Sinomicrobium weinanense]